ncbi:hypothetical protein VaNZ11_015237 [Volvox africanus]|uniref:Pherophorin domain-containing protein n=1 Tax=Volvox africanus TaxID=51714 RepID=A0ABQ5SLA5_9CHLO|nr:hypothetical protein VaNZ11_015237 [Volvox africanus]
MPHVLSCLFWPDMEPNKKLERTILVMMLTTILTSTSHLWRTSATAQDALEASQRVLLKTSSSSGSSSPIKVIHPPMPPPPAPPRKLRRPPPSPFPPPSPPLISRVYSPPPRPSPPPPYDVKSELFLPPPPPIPCTVCVSIGIDDNGMSVPFTSHADCYNVGNSIIQDMTVEADSVRARIYQSDGPSIDCSRGDLIRVCFKFVSNDDGNKLQKYIGARMIAWPYLLHYNLCEKVPNASVNIFIGGEGADPHATSCLQDERRVGCLAGPKVCTETQGATPFGVRPRLTKLPGYSSNTVMYCFEIVKVPVVHTNTRCGNSTVLRKAEITVGNDKGLVGMYIKPAQAANMKAIQPIWLPASMTLVVYIEWTLKEADGGHICLELYKTTNMASFCLGANNQGIPRCMINLVDPSGDCCPYYQPKVGRFNTIPSD